MTQYFKIVSENSGRCLCVPDASTQDSIHIQQCRWIGAHNQQWQVKEVADGGYHIIARHSGKVLDVEYASQDNGASVNQFHINGQNNQIWFFAGYLKDRAYTIQAAHSKKYLDVENNSTNDRALINQYEENGQYNQIWRFYAVDAKGKSSPDPIDLRDYKIVFFIKDLTKLPQLSVPPSI